MQSSIGPLRWGIMSTARIVRLNWEAMRDSGAATLVAVASRDAGKAVARVEELQTEAPWPRMPEALGSYDALLAREDVDAVYIPLPTGIRKEWVIKAARAGKHVLVEKPCAVGAEDLRQMIDCCERNGVVFMDGVHFMHDERFKRMREMIGAGGQVGRVKWISSAFTFRSGADFTASDIRAKVSLEPAGCLGDLGWYCLRASLWAMNWEMPTRVSARVLDSVSAADGGEVMMACSGVLDFPGGASADFYCSFLSPLQKWLRVSGTEGNLHVPDFVRPLAEFDVDWELNHAGQPRTVEPAMRSEPRMFETFARVVRDEVPRRTWADIALKTQIVQDACMRSVALGRPVAP